MKARNNLKFREKLNQTKNVVLRFLFPPPAIIILLVPIAACFLICAMVFIGTESIPAYISYALAAYTLTVVSCRIPKIISFIQRFRNENRYALLWKNDAKLRVSISLYGSLFYNTAYAILQLGLGFYHKTIWYYAMFFYYLLLSVMRFFLLRHTRTETPGSNLPAELRKYRFCGIIMLVMNLALSVIIFYIISQARTFHHHEITTISMAAYTFTAFTLAIVNLIRYRKYHSPVFSAGKAISLATASVSMLTLEATMLTTFGTETDMEFRSLMLTLTGIAVSAFVIAMSIYMIVKSSKSLKSQI